MLLTAFIRRFGRLLHWRAARLGPAAGLLLSSLVAVAATLTVLTVALDGPDVRVEWEVDAEADVTGFDLARRSPADTTYLPLSSIQPTGQRRYFYTDRNVYGGISPAGPYTYRLIVRGGPTTQTYTATLTPTPSAIQRSWDTIKSMFR